MTDTKRITDPDELRGALAQFYGTETWYRHPFSSMLYTEGVRFFADAAGAYWLLDILLTEPAVRGAMRDEGFVHIEFQVNEGGARIDADDGDGRVLWSRTIEFTDAPLGLWEFYAVDGVLLLTSEY